MRVYWLPGIVCVLVSSFLNPRRSQSTWFPLLFADTFSENDHLEVLGCLNLHLIPLALLGWNPSFLILVLCAVEALFSSKILIQVIV